MRTVGVVYFPSFAPLDAYGPIQAFNLSFAPKADNPTSPDMTAPLYRVVSVGSAEGPCASGPTGGGPKTVIEHAFRSAPDVDILLIPGGAGTRPGVEDAALVDGIAALAQKTPIVATVCTGAALLAKSGYLDGKQATTNKTAWCWVIQQGPNVDWRCPPRWVDCVDPMTNRGWITSGGVAAGIDMALALIDKLNGNQVTANTQQLMEYTWPGSPDDDPFARLCPPPCVATTP